VTATDLIDRLAQHKTLGAAPREELAWLVAHGTLRRLDEGEVLSPRGVPVTGMFIVLTGHIAIFVDRGTGRSKAFEWRAGDVTGMLPYSRLVNPPGDNVAQEATEVLAIPRDDLAEMSRQCHEITSILVHKMLDRSRAFTASGLQDEKMVSLGKLSAGLAHELNNPAAAIRRSVSALSEAIADRDALHPPHSLIGVHPDSDRAPHEALARADAIDEVLELVDDSETAAALVDAGWSVDELRRAFVDMDDDAARDAAAWLAATANVEALLREVHTAGERISEIVGAV
jgi:CRP-like cAMP-binding protein